MPTGIELSAGILTGTNKPVDSKYGPYATTAAALTDIPAALRYQGLTVGITTASGVVEYWFRAGVGDADFVEKTTGSSGVPAGALIISKTYAELKTLKDANQLVPGQWYKITDFQLKWWNISINDNTVKTSAYTEPLNVLAVSSSKFSTVASSDLYPTDIIYYDFEATSSRSWGPGDLNFNPIPNFKGDIFRRIDPINDIDICYDWRHITVNCCRPDLSQITTWSAALTFNQYDAVKHNGKIFISTIDNNTATTTDAFRWEPFSDYNEEFTYFPTDESFCLTLVKPVTGFTDIYNYNNYLSNNPNTAYIFNVPPLTSTRVQKYTFNDNAESVGNRSFHSASVKLGLNSHSNLFCGYGGFTDLGIRASYNLFGEAYKSINAVVEFQRNIIGRFVENNSFGSDVRVNQFSSQFTQNKLGDGILYNKFSRRQMGNIFDNQVIGNIFCGGMDSNKFGTTVIGNFLRASFQKNNVSLIFCGNDLWFYCGSNTTLGSFTDNKSRGSVGLNTFGGGCEKNTFSTFEKNEVGLNCKNNIFPLYCLINKIGTGFSNNTSTSSAIASGEMYYNIIGMDFQNNVIGPVFRMNEIGTYTYGCNFGNTFRRNKITNGDYNGYAGGWNVVGLNFSAATHAANNYDKTFFKNAASQLRLSYHNAADQLVVTSPTA